MPPETHVIIPAGTLIYIGGFPFKTIQDTVVEGTEENLKLGLKQLKHAQEHGEPVPTESVSA